MKTNLSLPTGHNLHIALPSVSIVQFRTAPLKAVLNWAEHSVREQLYLLEMFKLVVRFLIDVFDLGEQLCSRPMGRRSDV